VVLFSVVLFSGCKKYDEQTFDFSTSAPPYVALKTYTTKTVTQGGNLSFTVVVRTALQQPVTITYAITGGFSLSGTYTLARNTVEGIVTVPIPAGTIPAGSTSVSGTLNLTTATTTAGSITVGRISPTNEKFTVKVNQ
jgi:hypothetical protein